MGDRFKGVSSALSTRNSALLLCLAVTLLAALAFLLAGLSGAEGQIIMPLDDVYIHFQYARQLAIGQPYVYNTGQAPTSGATSLLYPYLLALGYTLGFHDLNLGLWALLLGGLALMGSLWALYSIFCHFELSHRLSLFLIVIYTLTGSITWHYFSGMETGVLLCFLLWTLLGLLQKRLLLFVLAAILLTLTRPEGGVLAALACFAMLLQLWGDYRQQKMKLALLILPILAIGIQPLVNWLVTGSSVATGNQAKSILATVPHDWALILPRLIENFLRMLGELLTAYAPVEGWYLAPFFAPLAAISLFMLLVQRRWTITALLIGAWMLALMGAISTLDTAFWHFKRYQMPLFMLCFPLVAYGLNRLLNSRFKVVAYVYTGFLGLFSLLLSAQFLYYHQQNVRYVYQQPYQMALWLQANTPEDALIAVHDVGMMRYIGGRNTLDIVGLTSPNAATYWRNGVGSVAELLIAEQPDFIASYGRGHGYGLAYLADTDLYANLQAEFPIVNWQRYLNVALATDTQAIYRPDYSRTFQANGLNVGNIASETAHNYTWQSQDLTGFISEVYQFDGVLDAIRKINDSESFTLSLENNPPENQTILVMRVHPQFAGSIRIYGNEDYLATRWIPAMAGHWLELRTLVPPNVSQFRIEADFPEGFYASSYHYLESRLYDPCCPSASPLAVFQDGHLQLSELTITQTDTLDINLAWYADGQNFGDYRFFVHLYDDTSQPPVSQWDGYITGQPLGNWLEGRTETSIRLNLDNLATRRYTLALGFYNPNPPSERLMPISAVYDVSPDGRLWLGAIEVAQ